MVDTNQSIGAAIEAVTDESLGVKDDAEETVEEAPKGKSIDELAEASDEEAPAEAVEEVAEEAAEEGEEETEEEGEEETEEEEEAATDPADIFDNLTPEQIAAIKADPNLNTLRKALMKGYEARTTEFKQLVQLGDAWRQDPARVVQALAETIGLAVTPKQAAAAAAAAATTGAAVDPMEQAGKELEALFGDQIGPRVRGVFEKWADARMGSALGKAVTPLRDSLGKVTAENERARMMSEETTFKTRHKLTPDVEKAIVDLGNSGKIIPGPNTSPSEYLETLYSVVTADRVRKSASKAGGNVAKKLATKIEANRRDREPAGVSGRGGSVKPVSKIANAKSISEALDLAEAELQAEGL
jgi:hypothetical protein